MIHEGMRRMRWLTAAGALLSLAACGNPEEPEPTPTPTPAACGTQADYDAAVADASQETQADIYNGLIAITPDNPALTWNADKSAVLMVVWTTYTGYKVGDNALTRDVFVTAAPQVQQLCKTVTDDAQRIKRVNEYLGLPPASDADNARQFVEMWVKPGDMFRPCPDAEITDTVCELTFPATASSEHKTWINNYYASSYGFWQKTRYPWTGLGFTYDWCSGDSSHHGASEFVIRSGSTVTVKAIIDRNTYCAQ